MLHVPCLRVPAGAWAPPERGPWPAPTCGLLLVDGLVARHVALADRAATQLLGPGDMLDPWTRGSELLPCDVRWSVHEPATMAVLDGRFATAVRRWPGLAAIVHERLVAVADRLATHLAICQLPRVEQRVLALLWHLAERFGRVTPDGVLLPLRLTHRLVGELAGAQRPTVSLAFAALFEDGRVTRRENGSLLLAAASRAWLEPGAQAGRVPAAAPPAVAPAPAERSDSDLRERVGLLRGDFSAQRERTLATLMRTTALRHERAAIAAERGAESPAAGGDSARDEAA